MSRRRVRCAHAEQGLSLMNVTLSSRTHSRWNVFLHPQHLSPAGTPDPGRGPDGAAFSTSGGASLRAHSGWRPWWSFPIILMRCGADRPGTTRLSLLKRHVSPRQSDICCWQVNRHPGISGGSLSCGNGAFGSIRSAMLAIMPGLWIIFITTRSSMGSSPKSVIGRIRRFTVMSGSVCIQTTGRVLPWLEPKAAMVNLTNNPRAHSAP